jgi:hypothetical protein
VLADIVNHGAAITVDASVIDCRANLRHRDASATHLFFRVERKAKPPDEYLQWRLLNFSTVAENPYRGLIACIHLAASTNLRAGKSRNLSCPAKFLKYKRETEERTRPE